MVSVHDCNMVLKLGVQAQQTLLDLWTE